MKDALARLVVEVERMKKLSYMAALAVLPSVITLLLDLIGRMVDEIETLKKGQ